MEKRYYIIEHGRQAGPFTAEELRYRNLNAKTMVWREGLADWVEAGTLPEFHGTLAPEWNPEAQAASSRSEGEWNQEYIPHTNWLPWAIVTTVLGCMTSCITLILGIIGIVQANKANEYFSRGMVEQGESANNIAKTMVIIGLVMVGIAIIGVIALFTCGGMAQIMAEIANID